MHRNTHSTSPAIKKLLQLASRQFGAFAAHQAASCGLTRGELRSLIDRGLVHRRRRRLFVVAGSHDSYQRRTMEAVLAAPPGAATSHMTAAHLHAGTAHPPLVHLTVSDEQRLRLDGVVGHRSALPPSHVAWIGPIPVTSLARTAVDLASLGDLDLLTEFLDPLLVAKRLTAGRVLRALDDIIQAPGRHGTQLLRAALAVWSDPIEPGSPAEARLLRRLTELGLGGFETQFEVRVGDRSRFLDVAWPDDLAGLEYSGKLAHGPRRWASDELRAAELEALGWRLREVDAPDLMPGERQLWHWLRTHLRPS